MEQTEEKEHEVTWDGARKGMQSVCNQIRIVLLYVRPQKALVENICLQFN